MFFEKHSAILFLCLAKVYGLGEIIEWKPSTNKQTTFNNQNWTMIRDEFDKLHLVFFQMPFKMKFQSVENDVSFYLYRRNMDEVVLLKSGDFDTLRKISWKPENPLKVIVHGYKVNYLTEGIQKMKDQILEREDANVILVDWQIKASSSFYPNSAAETKIIGQALAKLIEFLIETKVSLKKIHLIGHSLGAHVCGVAGILIKKKIGLIGRITGLDPALPVFGVATTEERLDRNDADFVDCIHTCGGLWGVLEPICMSDFYPNGGRSSQPGCHWYDFGFCSHSRAHELFTESIMPNHEFESYTCQNLGDVFTTSCENQGTLMGYPASKKFQGIFYVKTNSAFPFAPNWTNSTKVS